MRMHMLFSVASPAHSLLVAFCHALSCDFSRSALLQVFLAFWALKNYFLYFLVLTVQKNTSSPFGGSEENKQYFTSREG